MQFHSHASLLLNQGANVAAVAKRLGHSSPATTLNVYSHVYRNEDMTIANMLDNVVKKRQPPE
ncbi:MAG: tyrosine-type recombinase/integrase [Anaerovibrio sp.]|uniref:tyrosine-type recombinase/integrase n=1 Tax=Anaerovibrio sp. TaxID=1872532 RepID=UPI00342C99EE|nr:tyrosine-type recombinase/integrase [Anaerovibrio sp.]